MRLPITLLALLLAGTALAETPAPDAAVPPANIRVTFIKPETFIDATYDNRPSTRTQVTGDIAKLFAELSKRYLPQNQRLEVEVTDIDLAGRYEPWQTDNRESRFVREGTWPSMAFKYRLLEGEREVAKGEEQLADMSFLTQPAPRTSNDRLRYEKRMLDDWFRARFGAQAGKKAP